MRIILFYNGRTGFTKRYADWIAEELDCEIKPYKYFAETDIAEDDIIIYGSRIHAGRIEHLSKVKSQVKNNLIVFAVGATPETASNAVNSTWANNFTESELESIPHFYMQSGLDYNKMGFIDKTMMKTVAKIMSKKKSRDVEEAGFKQAIQDSYDISSKEFIMPLVNFVKDKIK